MTYEEYKKQKLNNVNLTSEKDSNTTSLANNRYEEYKKSKISMSTSTTNMQATKNSGNLEIAGPSKEDHYATVIQKGIQDKISLESEKENKKETYIPILSDIRKMDQEILSLGQSRREQEAKEKVSNMSLEELQNYKESDKLSNAVAGTVSLGLTDVYNEQKERNNVSTKIYDEFLDKLRNEKDKYISKVGEENYNKLYEEAYQNSSKRPVDESFYKQLRLNIGSGITSGVTNIANAGAMLINNELGKNVSDSTQWARDLNTGILTGNQNRSGIEKGVLNASNTIGNMVPVMAATGVNPALGNVALFGNAAGGAYNQALDNGANLEQAKINAILSGGTELAIEKISGGLSNKLLGSKALINPSNLTKRIRNKVVKGVVDTGLDVLGEGLEEVASSAIQPWIDRVTYNPNAENATGEELWTSFKDSILPTLLLQGIGATTNGINRYYNKQVEQIQNSNLSQEQKTELINKTTEQRNKMLNEVQNNTQIAQNTPNNEQISQNNVQNAQDLQKTGQNDTEKFSQQVEQWKNNNWDTTKDLVVLEHTPQIYQDLGLRDLAITVNPEKLTSIYYSKGRGKKNYHGLEEIVKQIPEALKKPLNIVESNTRDSSIIVITDLSDKNGNIITVPISIDDQGNLSIEEFFNGEAVNKMSSAYGRENYDYNVSKKGNYYDGWMQENLKNNRIVYDIDEGIIKKRVNGRWLQLPNAVDSLNIENDVLDNNIIPNQQNYVNNSQNSENIMPSVEQLQEFDSRQNKQAYESLNGKVEEVQENSNEEKIAEILDDTKSKKINKKELAKDLVNDFKRAFVDAGTDIAEIGKIANDKTLYHMFNSAKQSGQSANYMISEAQTNLQGDTVGKSLMDIFEPIRQKGQDYYKEFEYYIYHLHNIDRMQQGKPVFGKNVTADDSKNVVKEFEAKYPEFPEYAEDIRKWNANLQQYRIDTGLISQEQADIMNEMYPNYVPTYRDTNGISGATKSGSIVKIVDTIKKATGSNKDILPLHEQMARQVMQTVQAGRRNVLGMQLYNDAIKNADKLGEYVQEIKTTKEDIETDADFEFEKQDLEGKFVVYDNGKKVEMQVSKGVLEGLKSLSSAKWENNLLSKGMKKANSTFKKLVTEWNPGFLIKNAVRDIQDAGFYSENMKEFYKNYPQAWKEITSNGKLWQKYLAMGGSDASLFDFEQGYIAPKERLLHKSVEKLPTKLQQTKLAESIPYEGLSKTVIGKIGEVNFLVEQAPRFAEFLRIYNESDKSYNALMEAMYGAADITVNFGRSGTWGKFINNNLVPFFNPAIQGTSKTLRTITGGGNVQSRKNFAKHMANIVGKGVLLGVAPTMINHILLEVFGGDDYDDLNERDKDMYFLIPTGDGKYFKLPKGRVLSVIGGFVRRGFDYATGDKDAYKGFGKFALGQTAPSNPFENSLYSPIQAVKTNTTWYGTPIENESLQNYRPSQRYDEGTTEFSKWLGEKINYSPKKIDYLLDAYGGAVADVLMPLNTKKAESSGLGKSFTLDSTTSNRLSTDFYDTIEELTYDKNDDDQIAKMQLKYMNDVKAKTQDINKQIKDLQAGSTGDKEKLEKVRELKKEVNTLQRDALNTYEKYGETASNYYEEDAFIQFALRGTKEDTTEETKQEKIEKTVKAYTDRDMFGAEYALSEYNKDVFENQQKAEEQGIDAEIFFKAYFAQKGIEGDKNLNGKAISGSEKKNKRAALDKAVSKNLTTYQMKTLYKIFNVD